MPQAVIRKGSVYHIGRLFFGPIKQALYIIGCLSFSLAVTAQSSAQLTNNADPLRMAQVINRAYDELAEHSLQHLQLAVHQPGTVAAQSSLGEVLQHINQVADQTQPLQAQSEAGERLLSAWEELLGGYSFVFRSNLSGLSQPAQLNAVAMENYLVTYQQVTERLEQSTATFLQARRAYHQELGVQFRANARQLQALQQLRQLNAYQLSIFVAVLRVEALNEQFLAAFSAHDAARMQALRPQLRTAILQSQRELEGLLPYPNQDQYRQLGLAYLTFIAELNSSGYAALLRQLNGSPQAAAADYNSCIQRLNQELPGHRRACVEAREALMKAFLPAPELLRSRI